MKIIRALLLLAVLPSIELRLHVAHAFLVPQQKQQLTRIGPLSQKFALQVNRVNSDRYTPSKIDENKEYDAIVIGSGIGGLAAASLMAQNNQKVLVLEQHYVAGGCCHTFQAKGYPFAAGIHYVGQVGDEKTSAKKLCDSLTRPDDPIVWDKMSKLYDMVVIGGHHYKVLAGENAMKHHLIEKFPKERAAVNKYFELLKEANEAFSRCSVIKSLPIPMVRFLTRTGLDRVLNGGFHKFTRQTLQQVLESITDNTELQAVLAYNYVDYGVEPSRVPFLMHSIVANGYKEGTYYPHGGPSTIAEKIIATINEHGGRVLTSAAVEKILLDKETGAVSGVQMKDGNTIAAKVVCSDAGLTNTATKLLPEGLVEIELDNTPDCISSGKLHSGMSGLNLFVGLKGDPKDFPSCNYWIHPTNKLDLQADFQQTLTLEEALVLEAEDIGPIAATFACNKDKAWAVNHPGKISIEIMAPVPFHWFEKFQDTFDKKTKSHGPEYEAVKREFADKIWSRVVEIVNQSGAKLPSTLDEVDYIDVGTPLSFAHFLGDPRGSWYGLDADRQRFNPKNFYLRLRPEVPEVPGLYLTGQDAMTLGFVGAMFGGLMCASKVLGVHNPSDLLRDQKEDIKSDTAVMAGQPA